MSKKILKEKTFYLISALVEDSSDFSKLNRYETRTEAVDKAKQIIEWRRQKGEPEISFYILKVVSKVGIQNAPIVVSNLV